MDILTSYTFSELAGIAVVVFLLGMSKGGFPVGPIALPMLVLLWPDSIEPAKTSVSFILPLLCIMDMVAVAFYRKHISWKTIMPLFPWAIVSVFITAFVFMSTSSAILEVPDRALKFLIGIIGIFFVVHRLFQRVITNRIRSSDKIHPATTATLGIITGVSSTLAHAAGPVISMYLLMAKLPKMSLAGTWTGFFLVLNLVKLIPFGMCGRLETPNLQLGLYMAPVIPLGVAAGYFTVKRLNAKHYLAFIYAILLVTSVTLILKSI